MTLDAHGSGKIYFSTPVRIVTASLCIQPQNGLKPQDNCVAGVNGRVSELPAADREPASQPHGMPPSGHAQVPATAGMQQVLLTGSATQGQPRSGRPQRAAAKPAPVSDLDTEEDEDYEVSSDPDCGLRVCLRLSSLASRAGAGQWLRLAKLCHEHGRHVLTC